MALTRSVDQVDETGRELLTYGTPDFPIAFFDDDLTKIVAPPHWHEEFEIIIVKKGVVHARIAGNSFALAAGEGYFANSGILHSETLKTKTGCQHALVFSPRIISQAEDLIWQSCVAPILKNARLPYIRLSAAVPWQKDFLALVERAWSFGAYDRENYPIEVRDSLSRAFSLIAVNADSIGSEIHCSGGYRRDELRMKKALRFIESNYAEEITIEDIARSAEVSVSTCLRLFRTVLGTTPVQYLIVYRLRRAAEELKHPNGSTVTEIAYSCGFSDASYFDRCFRKGYSITPTEYRSQQGDQ